MKNLEVDEEERYYVETIKVRRNVTSAAERYLYECSASPNLFKMFIEVAIMNWKAKCKV